IAAIADTFDALTSKRPYKDPYPPEVVYDIMKEERGEHFDPEILDICIANFDQFLEIRGKVGTFEGEAYQKFLFSERDRINGKID
ncbi:MAG: two-component system response regulator, partial [Desulfobacterales bacterium]|nr:two-component system response regulator [Desulfobacterales bacterium]